MDTSFSEFIYLISQSMPLLITLLLTFALIFINGWADARNAMDVCISTRALRPKPAVAMAVTFNFLGMMIFTLLNTSVAQTIFRLVDFNLQPEDALWALCGAMVAVVLWSAASPYLGIPTSENHALIAGFIGASAALNNGFNGVNPAEGQKVILGLAVSTAGAYFMAYLIVKAIHLIFRNIDRRKSLPFFQRGQVAGSAGMAFMHGAQNGQKFMAVLLLGTIFSKGINGSTSFVIPIWLLVTGSLVMAAGTLVGGIRFIKSIGIDKVKFESYQGFAADFAGTATLLAASLLGIPVSSTHTKMSAIMGVGAARRFSSVRWRAAKEIIWTWLLTYPGCGFAGFLMVKLVQQLF